MRKGKKKMTIGKPHRGKKHAKLFHRGGRNI